MKSIHYNIPIYHYLPTMATVFAYSGYYIRYYTVLYGIDRTLNSLREIIAQLIFVHLDTHSHFPKENTKKKFKKRSLSPNLPGVS